MSSTVIDRARPAGHRAPHRGSGFTGTLGLLRLYLRRDRVASTLLLLLPMPLETRTVIALLFGPTVGIAIHVAALARRPD